VAKAPASTLDNVIALAKKRGFVFPAGEIYGGTRSAWDYGPLGVELKENIKRQWWRNFVTARADMVGLDSSIILPKRVWEASGHVATFTDPLVECKSCHNRFREDHLLEAFEEKKGRAPEGGMAEIACPNCGTRGEFTPPQQFSGLVKTFLGPVDSEAGLHYLRPETAQGIFVNFLNVVTATRQKPPFGIGQVGKAFRNEITPGNFIFRTREFEQMEIEYFTPPAEADEHFAAWVEECWNWFIDLGIKEENLRRFDVPEDERAHYSAGTIDFEYRFGFQGSEWGELMGIANRTDFDLSSHTEGSGTKMQYFDQAADERYTPYVIEPSFGLTRAMMAFLVDAYVEDEAPNAKGGVDKRTVLRLDPRLAPVKVAVLPLSKSEDLVPRATELADRLRKHWNVELDVTQAIGRRYRRQDEIGTPFCLTVDFETATDQAVTIRERDSMAQERAAQHPSPPHRRRGRCRRAARRRPIGDVGDMLDVHRSLSRGPQQRRHRAG
jgi:glycyl-tRNA synthetase